jgi:hypothetical protein
MPDSTELVAIKVTGDESEFRRAVDAMRKAIIKRFKLKPLRVGATKPHPKEPTLFDRLER